MKKVFYKRILSEGFYHFVKTLRTDNIAEEFLTSQFFVSSSDFEGFSLVIR